MYEKLPSELQIQGEIYTTLWNEEKEARRCLFHVPNETTFDNGQQASSGVIPGIVDLIFVWDGRTWYIELKDDRGVISRSQKVIHALWKVQGYDTYVFYNASDCIAFIKFIIAQKGKAFSLHGLALFDSFISPFSKAEKYEEYLAELQAWKKTNREKRAATGGFKFRKK